MENSQNPAAWVVSRGKPIKQSNFGVYKQSICSGEGKNFRTVRITGDTPQIVQEVANNAAAAPELLKALQQAINTIECGIEAGLILSIDGKKPELPFLPEWHAAVAKAKGAI